MDTVTTLTHIVQHEVDLYAGKAAGGKLYSLADEQRQTYAVVVVPDSPNERPAWVLVMARIVDYRVIIEEDRTDKPLVDALMINGGIPRERIILAYAGETIPEPKST